VDHASVRRPSIHISIAGDIMFKTILVPTDGSELANKAITAAVEFAKLTRGKIIGLAVAEPYPFSPLGETAFMPDVAGYEKGANEAAQAHVNRISALASAADVSCQTMTALSFDPSDEIVKAAKQHGCDIIFMASHGRRGLDRLLLGSETQKVLAHSTIPVMVFR
jgi:nucleotide-binding universal stress UspA family protein